MLVRLADGCFRHRRLVVLAWVAALVGAFALAGAFGGEFKQDYLQPGSESQRVSNTLEDSFPQKAGDTMQVVVHSDSGVTTPEAQRTTRGDPGRGRPRRACRERHQPLHP